MIPRIVAYFETHWAWADDLLEGALIFVAVLMALPFVMAAL